MYDYKWDPSYLVGVQALGSFSIEIVLGLIIVTSTSLESWGLEIWDNKQKSIIMVNKGIDLILQHLNGLN